MTLCASYLQLRNSQCWLASVDWLAVILLASNTLVSVSKCRHANHRTRQSHSRNIISGPHSITAAPLARLCGTSWWRMRVCWGRPPLLYCHRLPQRHLHLQLPLQPLHQHHLVRQIPLLRHSRWKSSCVQGTLTCVRRAREGARLVAPRRTSTSASWTSARG